VLLASSPQPSVPNVEGVFSSSSSVSYVESLSMETADKMIEGNVYVDEELGFKVTFPKEWKTFGIHAERKEKGVTEVHFGLPLVAPDAAGKFFRIGSFWVLTPAEYARMHACDGEPLCFAPDKIEQGNGVIYAQGMYYIAGGYEPCTDEPVASNEKEFCSLHSLMLKDEASWSFEVL